MTDYGPDYSGLYIPSLQASVKIINDETMCSSDADCEQGTC